MTFGEVLKEHESLPSPSSVSAVTRTMPSWAYRSLHMRPIHCPQLIAFFLESERHGSGERGEGDG